MRNPARIAPKLLTSPVAGNSGPGLAGGIGTPAAVASAFLMGADFVVTGSINQCTVEAGTSEVVKDMLEKINIQDTAYAPAGDMFEMGAIVQVLKRGVFFPARANKLYELYKNHNSISEIDFDTQERIQKKYFKRSFEEVYSEVKKYTNSLKIEKAERDPKYKMALIFKWYFRNTFTAFWCMNNKFIIIFKFIKHLISIENIMFILIWR